MIDLSGPNLRELPWSNYAHCQIALIHSHWKRICYGLMHSSEVLECLVISSPLKVIN